jgi:hypothetical protein
MMQIVSGSLLASVLTVSRSEAKDVENCEQAKLLLTEGKVFPYNWTDIEHIKTHFK